MYEFLGIVASLIILCGFLCKGEKNIRTVNIFGCILYVIYGVLIGSFSVCFVNGVLIIVHAARLIKLKN